MVKIFLDDNRIAPVGFTLIKSGEELLNSLKDNKLNISILSFDHDLGLNHISGYDTIKKLINEQPESLIHIEKIQVHSNNMIGGQNIIQYLKAAKKANVLPDKLFIDNTIYQYSAGKLLKTQYTWS